MDGTTKIPISYILVSSHFTRIQFSVISGWVTFGLPTPLPQGRSTNVSECAPPPTYSEMVILGYCVR